jgi:hypothetical protein
MSSIEYDGTPGKPAFMEPTEKPPSPIKVEERLCHPDRRNVDYPGVDFVGADDIAHISPTLVEDVAEKVFPLTIRMIELPQGKERQAYGQLGLILPHDAEQGEGLEMKPLLVTALHNVALENMCKFLYASVKVGSVPYVVEWPGSSKQRRN